MERPGAMRKFMDKITSLSNYPALLTQIKQRIRVAQARAVMSANAEMISMYWNIRNNISEVKGFSERNMGRMIAFFKTYSDLGLILPQTVAKLPSSSKMPQAVAQLKPSIKQIETELSSSTKI